VTNIIGASGALVKVRLSNPRPRPFLLGDGVKAFPGTVEVYALVSDGADGTSVFPELIRFPLGLACVRTLRRPPADGWPAREIRIYTVDLEVVGGVRLRGLEVADGAGGLDFARTAGGAVPAYHVVLGRDVWRRARLLSGGRNGRGRERTNSSQ
jgi:hypothetical protein